MAFGKITKEDLIAAGLDPDKLKEYQEQGVRKNDLATMKAELTTTVTDLIKAGFAELEGKLPKPIVEDKENNNNNNNNNNDDQPTDQDRFLTDPTKFVKDEVSKVGAGAAIEFKRMSRNLAYKNATDTLKGFKNPTLKAEIDEEWKKYPPEKMAQFNADPEQLIQQIHDMVLGKHHDEIVQDTNKRDGKFNLVHSGSGSGTGAVSTGGNSSGDKRILTATEQAMARQYGMTDDEWIKADADMEAEEATRHSKVGAK
jgi:hypothetical protein